MQDFFSLPEKKCFELFRIWRSRELGSKFQRFNIFAWNYCCVQRWRRLSMHNVELMATDKPYNSPISGIGSTNGCSKVRCNLRIWHHLTRVVTFMEPKQYTKQKSKSYQRNRRRRTTKTPSSPLAASHKDTFSQATATRHTIFIFFFPLCWLKNRNVNDYLHWKRLYKCWLGTTNKLT